MRPALLSAGLALIIYAITLGGTYVYDDRYIVLNDPRIYDVALWKEFWTKDYFNGGADNLYRPVVSMSYAVQAKVHGTGENRAWAFHLVNWLLHAGVSAAVAELARRLTRSTGAALIAGLLFAAHPIHVEAVANIVGRAELLCGLGIISALVLFLAPLTPARTIAIWGCFILALLSKEQGMLLPLLLVLLIPLRNEPLATQRTPGLILLLLTIWTSATYLLVRERILKFYWDRAFLDPTINPMIDSTGVDRWLLPFSLLGRYVALLIAPVKLLLDYGGETIGSRVHFNDPYFWLGVIALLSWTTACLFAAIKRQHVILFCLLAIALLYGLVANIITLIGTNFAERLMYIPSAFVCILAGMLLMKLPRRVAVTIASCVIALFALRSVTYAAKWNTPIALFEQSLEQEPRSIRLYLLLSEEWERRGEIDRARQIMAKSREVMPGYYRLWLNSARIEMDAGDFAAARRFALAGQKIKPTGSGVAMLEAIHEAEARASTRPATAPTP